MDSIKCLDKYIKDNFPNLLLRKPLFYNSKVGIRFKIGCSSIHYSEKRYIESAYIRSIMVFEEIFNHDTDIYIVVNSHKHIEDTENEEQMEDILNTYLKNKMLNSEIGFIKMPYIYDEDDEELSINTFRYCLSCKVKDIDYRRLLKAI